MAKKLCYLPEKHLKASSKLSIPGSPLAFQFQITRFSTRTCRSGSVLICSLTGWWSWTRPVTSSSQGTSSSGFLGQASAPPCMSERWWRTCLANSGRLQLAVTSASSWLPRRGAIRVLQAALLSFPDCNHL